MQIVVRAIFIVVFSLALAYACGAHAHDVWADGSTIPPWVKSMCCGPADAHRDDLIDRIDGKTYVRGLENPVDEEKIFDAVLDGGNHTPEQLLAKAMKVVKAKTG